MNQGRGRLVNGQEPVRNKPWYSAAQEGATLENNVLYISSEQEGRIVDVATKKG